MLKKRYVGLLVLFVIGIFAMAVVSAADNATDVLEADSVVGFDEDLEKKVCYAEIEENSDVLADEDEHALSQDKSYDVLSADPVPYDMYSINFIKDSFEISGKNGGDVTFYVSVCQVAGYYKYNFHFEVYDVIGNQLADDKFYSTSDESDSYDYPFSPKEIAPGSYNMIIRNDCDGVIMDSASLEVSGDGTVTADNYSSIYGSGANMVVNVTDNDTGLPIKYIGIDAVFTDGKTSVKRTYLTNASGQVSFMPPVGVGTWSVSFSAALSCINANGNATLTIAKAPTMISASPATAVYHKNARIPRLL